MDEGLDQDAPDTAQRDPVHRRLLCLFWWVPLLPVFYVLSTGPALRVLPPSIFGPVYRPLITLEEHSKLLDRFLTWYMEDVWKCHMW